MGKGSRWVQYRSVRFEPECFVLGMVDCGLWRREDVSGWGWGRAHGSGIFRLFGSRTLGEDRHGLREWVSLRVGLQLKLCRFVMVLSLLLLEMLIALFQLKTRLP
ncbi:hypothetical protein EJ04DRAFT_365333 [Polyplosphaeria fusca]|uniref:Uncharacterized protein n=1 Tax=Polyplosphaeria fusca TaxID=682080 RepID=A0A9P4UZZ2_9PLEO|nr:hypothetical protein EJ04DRAFT_365333 [Polyplosphaeria fusca]